MMSEKTRPSETHSEVVVGLPRACTDETAAVEFLERQRWGDAPKCPHCESPSVVKLLDDKTGERNGRFLWWCRECHRQFTVRVGTVFEDSRLPLRNWCYAFWAACAGKKGVSAKQIQRQCQISYKSALFLMHRIRWAMAAPNAGEKLAGTVEVDETYVGGKPRKDGKHHKCGRGTAKSPVVALVQRDGDVRTSVVADVSAKSLRAAIDENVERTARIDTDDFCPYRDLTYTWPGTSA